jgi:hypothetical protein
MDQIELRRACAWVGNSAAVAMKNHALLKRTDSIDAAGSTVPDFEGRNSNENSAAKR